MICEKCGAMVDVPREYVPPFDHEVEEKTGCRISGHAILFTAHAALRFICKGILLNCRAAEIYLIFEERAFPQMIGGRKRLFYFPTMHLHWRIYAEQCL